MKNVEVPTTGAEKIIVVIEAMHIEKVHNLEVILHSENFDIMVDENVQDLNVNHSVVGMRVMNRVIGY